MAHLPPSTLRRALGACQTPSSPSLKLPMALLAGRSTRGLQQMRSLDMTSPVDCMGLAASPPASRMPRLCRRQDNLSSKEERQSLSPLAAGPCRAIPFQPKSNRNL